MDIVADTNILLAVALNEREKDHLIQITADASILAPEILPYEIGNALSALLKRGKLSEGEALNAEEAAARVPVRLVSVDIPASLQLAAKHGIYAYDAYFLQCARVHALPLLTLDNRMKQVAERLGVELVE